MRFKAELRNIRTFSKVVAALSPLDKIAWLHLEDDNVRFIVIPDRGSQVWSVFQRDFLFDNYQIHSLSAHNSIDIELPLASLQRALKSALNSTDAVLRLTKRDGVPVLSMTIHTMTNPRGGFGAFAGSGASGFRRPGFTREGTLLGDTLDEAASQRRGDEAMVASAAASAAIDLTTVKREREKTVTQDIPVRVLSAEATQNTTEPLQPEADVHIVLPPLLQLKAVSDRFTKLAHTASARGGGGGGGFSTQGLSSLLGTAGGFGGGGGGGGTTNTNTSSSHGSKLELSANMYGKLRLRLVTDSLSVETVWNDLENPPIAQEDLPMPLAEHPSTKFREAGPERFATVRVDGRDWSRVLSVGRLDGRVVACFVDGRSLMLHVYLPHPDDPDDGEEQSLITYHITSYST